MKIIREIDAEQWLGEGHPLPKGCYLCQPEVHWSADRTLVYFTFAELHARNWIDAVERAMPAPEKFEFMCHGLQVKLQIGREYWRQVMPFNVWSVKSEASIKGDHRAVYLDRSDEALISRREKGGPIRSRRARNTGLSMVPMGRGFRPVYLKPGDWLVKDGDAISAVPDADLQRMRA